MKEKSALQRIELTGFTAVIFTESTCQADGWFSLLGVCIF